MTDAEGMARALFHAARGRGRTSPNPMVGAVVVTPDGVVVGQGYHAQAGGPHAEVYALEMAGARARGATLYCTLEPCSHTGRTAPCVPRIVEAGIARVVAATEDPNPVVSGRGFAYLRAQGVVVDVGPGAAEAEALNAPFFTVMREGRPFVTMKAALSRDGCIAAAPGQCTAISGSEAQRHAHQLRAEVDAIAVGSGTLLVDNPRLTARGSWRARPLTRVVLDRRLRTPLDARLWETLDAGPVLIVTTASAVEQQPERRAALEARGAHLVLADGTIRGALQALVPRGIADLLLEGGAAVHAAAWREQVVDHLRLYVANQAFGPQGVRWLPDDAVWRAFEPAPRVEPLGCDTLIDGHVHRSH